MGTIASVILSIQSINLSTVISDTQFAHSLSLFTTPSKPIPQSNQYDQLPRQPTMDPEMNKLLKWSITNSDASKGAEDEGNAVDASKSQITPELISKLFGGGPSDADLMKAAIEVIKDPETDLENKLVAFDNFEQLIEGIDNAMNIQSLNLWPDLVSLLEHEETDIRRMAAWSVGTAVQNNPKTQAHVSFPT